MKYIKNKQTNELDLEDVPDQFYLDLLKVWGENAVEILSEMKEDDYAQYMESGAAILGKAYGMDVDDALDAMVDYSPEELAALIGEGLAQRTGRKFNGSKEVH